MTPYDETGFLVLIVSAVSFAIAVYVLALRMGGRPSRPPSAAWDRAFDITTVWLMRAVWAAGFLTLFAYLLGVALWIGVALCRACLWLIGRVGGASRPARAARVAVVPFFLLPSAYGVPLWLWVGFNVRCFTRNDEQCSADWWVPKGEPFPVLYRLLGEDYSRLLAVYGTEAAVVWVLVWRIALRAVGNGTHADREEQSGPGES